MNKNINKITSYLKYIIFIPLILFAQNEELDFSSDLDSVKNFTTQPQLKVYNSFDYQPAENITLIYDSDFGETTSRIEITDEGYLDINENDDFSYIQKMKYEDDGIYLLNADQQVNLFLFISKDINTEYPIPVLQLPKYLATNEEWIWEGFKVENDDTIDVRTVGKFIGEESITVPAGTFKTLRIQFEIETSDGENSLITQWMVRDVGRVKMDISIDGNGFIGTMISLLGYDEIEFNLKEIKHIKLAYKE